MSALHNKKVGSIGEDYALHFLLNKGYTLLERNYMIPIGELDLIMRRTSTLCFIEVKTRVGVSRGLPYEAVTDKKISSIKRTAQYYVLQNNLGHCKLSLEVVSIVLTSDLRVERLSHYLLD